MRVEYKTISEVTESFKKGIDIYTEEDDLLQIEKSLREIGFVTPIIIYNGTIVDGNTRLRIAEKIGIQIIPCLILEPKDDLDPRELSILLNMARRHMNRDTKVAYIEKLLQIKEEIEKRRKKQQDSKEELHNTSTCDSLPQDDVLTNEQIAKLAGVSTSSVKRVKFLKCNAPDMLEKVKAKEISLKAAVEQVRHNKEIKAEQFKNLHEEEKELQSLIEVNNETTQKIKELYRQLRELVINPPVISVTFITKITLVSFEIIEKSFEIFNKLSSYEQGKILDAIERLVDKYEELKEVYNANNF